MTLNRIARRSILQSNNRLRYLNATKPAVPLSSQLWMLTQHTQHQLQHQHRCFSKKWRTEYTKVNKFDQLEQELSALEDEQFSRMIGKEEDGVDVPALDLFHEDSALGSQAFENSRDFASLAVTETKDGDGNQAAPFKVIDPWYYTEDDVALNLQYEDLLEWSLDTVSDTSKQRVVLYKDEASTEHMHIPTLKALSEMALPLPAPPVPTENRKAYNKYRTRAERRTIVTAVAKLAEVRVARILRMDDDSEKQKAVDELFESIEEDVYSETPEISLLYKGHPKSSELFQKALTTYLIAVRRQEQQKHTRQSSESTSDKTKEIEKSDDEDDLNIDVESLAQYIVGEDDTNAVPVFMDLKKKGVKEYFSTTGVSGGIQEDWELAADSESKTIMLREPMRRIAQALKQSDVDETPARIYITGKKGVGKSTALTAVVAAARKEGSIVLFLPNCNEIRQHGKFTEPSLTHPGMFNLPILAMNLLTQLYEVHRKDLEGFNLTLKENIDLLPEEQKSMSLLELVQAGKDDVESSSMAYIATIEELMNQDKVPFVLAFDEYNAMIDDPMYFHMDYNNADEPIPHHMQTLFQPIICAGFGEYNSPFMKRGGFIAAIDHTRPIRQAVTDRACSKLENEGLTNIEVGRYSHVEVDHMLSNYEKIGIGKLRIYGAEVIENEEEISLLRMKTGCVGLNVLNSIIV